MRRSKSCTTTAARRPHCTERGFFVDFGPRVRTPRPSVRRFFPPKVASECAHDPTCSATTSSSSSLLLSPPLPWLMTALWACAAAAAEGTAAAETDEDSRGSRCPTAAAHAILSIAYYSLSRRPQCHQDRRSQPASNEVFADVAVLPNT